MDEYLVNQQRIKELFEKRRSLEEAIKQIDNDIEKLEE